MCHYFMYHQKGKTPTLFIKLWDTTDCKKHPDCGDVKMKSGYQKNIYMWDMLLWATRASLLSILQPLVLAPPLAFFSDLGLSLVLSHLNLCSSWSSCQPFCTLYSLPGILPISFSYHYLILFLICTSSTMRKNARQKGYVFTKLASQIDTIVFSYCRTSI